MGILLQPEFIIAYLKHSANDQRFQALTRFLEGPGANHWPTMSVVGYGMSRQSIIAASNLSEHDKREMETRLRTLRQEFKQGGYLYEFDTDSADEWAILRDECSSKGIALDAERQVEYAIALATNQTILAPAHAQHVYLPYPSIRIQYL